MEQRFSVSSLGRTAFIALLCGSLIMLFSLGIRHGFGLFLKPVTVDQGWTRESFSFAIALQNLIWGASQPFVGYLADKFGAPRVITVGAVLYAAGLWIMATTANETSFIIAAGLLIGLGLAGTTFPVIFGTISRLVSPTHRSMAMGFAMAFGSFGQFIMLPVTLGLLSWLDWPGAFVALSLLALIMFPLAFGLREPRLPETASTEPQIGVMHAIKEAFTTRDFWLLSFGFFTCGFQVVFIVLHLPAYLADRGLDNSVATAVLALIGLFNIAGTYYAGLWGGKYRKPMLLSWLYILRGLVIVGFLLLPISAYSAYGFGILMGVFWLSTVPLTNGVVASVWGVKHLSMLGGVVFFWHQLGSFLGGWLGGKLYDTTGSYESIWLITIGLSVLSAILNWPISEQPASERKQRVSA